MKQLTCEMCGSTELIKQDGYFVCQVCGCKYSVEEAKKMMIEGTVEVQGVVSVNRNKEVESLLTRMYDFIESGKFKEADSYCERILDIDPECSEAYLGKILNEYESSWSPSINIEDSEYYDKMCANANEVIKEKLKQREEYSLKVIYDIENGEKVLRHVGRLVKNIEIEKDTKRIGFKACSGCSFLERIEIPDTVTSIGDSAFEYCTSLTSVVIGDSVTSIGDDAFYRCTSLTSIEIPDSVTSIGYRAFAFCTSLTSIVIPNNVESIGQEAFGWCESLKNVIIGDGITNIDEDAFYCCPIEKAKIPAIAWPYITANDSLKEVVITSGKSIDDTDFYGDLRSLKSITIPSSITAINCRFEDCESLNKVNFLGTVDQWAEIDFAVKSSNPTFKSCDLYINDELLEKVDLTTATKISKCAFINCKSLKSVTISNSVNSVGYWCFFNCSNLENIKTPSKLYDSIYKELYSLPGEVNITCTDNNQKEAKSREDCCDNSLRQDKNLTAKSGGCYVATCVYGSYDCPEVWTLRRYRDDTLGATWYGRAFIKLYYAISPTLVKWFGKTKWFKKMWKGKLDRMVKKLQDNGVESTPYNDIEW